MYFSSSTTKVTGNRNSYKNLFGYQRGGVYQLDGVTFRDEESTYSNCTALLGGAISCTKCIIYSLTNTFTMNMANEGGVIYIESDSNLTSIKDTYK